MRDHGHDGGSPDEDSDASYGVECEGKQIEGNQDVRGRAVRR